MCGRYGTTMTMREAARRLSVDADKVFAGEAKPNYNAAPGTGQCAAIGMLEDPAAIGLSPTHWGFLPSWQRQPSKSSINMRIESADKRFWNKAFRKRRCVVPAGWWYEWTRENGLKQPYAIKPIDTDGFFFAGVWSVAKGVPDDHPLHGQQTFAILTQPALPAIEFVHPRMPIALDDKSARRWLAPLDSSRAMHDAIAESALRDYEAWPVSNRVNEPENNEPSLIERIADEGGR